MSIKEDNLLLTKHIIYFTLVAMTQNEDSIEIKAPVVWEDTPSQLENFWIYFLSLGVSLTASVFNFHYLWIIAIPLCIWFYLVTKNTIFSLWRDRLITQDGVLNLTNNQIELFRIVDIKWDQPLFMRIFGLGRLTLYTVSDINQKMITLNAVPKTITINSVDILLVDAWRHAVRVAQMAKGVRAIESV